MSNENENKCTSDVLEAFKNVVKGLEGLDYKLAWRVCRAALIILEPSVEERKRKEIGDDY